MSEDRAAPQEKTVSTDTTFTQSFDAQDWAAAFVRHVTENPAIATDEGTMLGWFANALMRGYDEYPRRNSKAEHGAQVNVPPPPHQSYDDPATWAKGAQEGETPGTRPETGPMRFAGDWTGLFIRGDNAFGYCLALGMVLDGKMSPAQDVLYRLQLRGLIDLLAGCNEQNEPKPQEMRPFSECTQGVQR